MQEGNAFEMATLLVSLLTGVGYDAYVVSGYAVKQTTTMDLKERMADLKEFVPNHYVVKEKSSVAGSSVKQSKYKVKQPKQLKSAFLMKQEERLKAMQAVQEKRQKEQDNIVTTIYQDDELKGLRVHSWVLVLSGKRQVSEAFFIEPSTGEVRDCECDEYLGLESVWSSNNYWVNMQVRINKLMIDLL